MTRAARLEAEVKRMDGQFVVWGQSDCSTWPAQWVADITGRPVEWPVYGSEEEARTLIERRGGLALIWAGIASDAGLGILHPADADLGDVGIVETRRFGEVGGIYGSHGIFFWRSERGVMALAPRHHTRIAAWRVP